MGNFLQGIGYKIESIIGMPTIDYIISSLKGHKYGSSLKLKEFQGLAKITKKFWLHCAVSKLTQNIGCLLQNFCSQHEKNGNSTVLCSVLGVILSQPTIGQSQADMEPWIHTIIISFYLFSTFQHKLSSSE